MVKQPAKAATRRKKERERNRKLYLFVFSQQFGDDEVERLLAAVLSDLLGELFVVLCGWRGYHHHEGACPLEEVLRLHAVAQIVEVFRFWKRGTAREVRKKPWYPLARGKRKYPIRESGATTRDEESRGTSIKIGSRAGNRVTSEPSLTHDVQFNLGLDTEMRR